MDWQLLRELGSFGVLAGTFVYMARYLMNGFSKKLDLIIAKLDKLIELQEVRNGKG